MIAGLLKRLFYILISGALGIAIGTGAIYVQGIPVRAGQDAAAKLLGDKAATICQNLTKATAKRVTLKGKIAVVDAIDGTIFTQYQDSLSNTRKASGSDEVAGVLCLKETSGDFDTDTYSNSSKTKYYYCYRKTRDLEANLIDVKTGKVVASTTLPGQDPPECPDKTDNTLTKTGDLPLASDINDWLN